jgi:hypothetical protein
MNDFHPSTYYLNCHPTATINNNNNNNNKTHERGR